MTETDWAAVTAFAVVVALGRCQQRLYARWQRMAGRGKPQQKMVVASARELAGFVWAIATDQPLRCR